MTRISRRHWFSMLLLTIMQQTAFAAQLIVQPASGNGNLPLEGMLILAEGDAEALPNSITLEALFVTEAGVADVSGVVDWHIDDMDVASLDPNTATLTFLGEGFTTITATLGSLEGSMGLTIEESEVGPLPTAIATDASEAVPRQELRDGAETFVQGLGDADIPISDLRNAVDNTSIADDRNAFTHDSGGLGRVTDSETGGLFVSKGSWFGLNIGGFPPTWVDGHLLWTDIDVIVLRPDAAEALAAGEMFSSSGLSAMGQIFLEELIHAAVHQAGVDDDIGMEAEEDMVKVFTGQIVPAMLRIMWLLEKPFEDWTQQDVNSLRTNLNFNIRQQINLLRQTWGDDKVDKFLEALGWKDADGDGVPDWLENLLEDHGLDPDSLPDTPDDLPEPPPEEPPGGGGGPGHLTPVNPHAPLDGR